MGPGRWAFYRFVLTTSYKHLFHSSTRLIVSITTTIVSSIIIISSIILAQSPSLSTPIRTVVASRNSTAYLFHHTSTMRRIAPVV